MNAARARMVKSFEVYRHYRGRTGIVRTLHHDLYSGQTWLTEIHEKRSASGESLRIETTTALDDMDRDDRELYEHRLHHELAADREAQPLL